MRESRAIRQKVKQVRFRHLKQLLEEGLALTPDTCTHNRKFHHPGVVASNGPVVGICVCPAQDGDMLCDKAWGGVERAQTCPFYEPAATKEEIKQEFHDFLATADLAVIAKAYPDMAALMWALQEEAPNRVVDLGESDFEGPTPEPPVDRLFPVKHKDQTFLLTSQEQADQITMALAEAEAEMAIAQSQLRDEVLVPVTVDEPQWVDKGGPGRGLAVLYQVLALLPARIQRWLP
jgi:hypothetical protein